MTKEVKQITVNSENLEIDGVVVIQPANAEGKAIIEQILKFASGETYTTPTQLTYNPASKCWTSKSSKIVLFNVAAESKEAINLIREYLKGEKAQSAKTDPTVLGGIVTTDGGVPVAVDTQEGESEDKPVLRVDKPRRGKTTG